MPINPAFTITNNSSVNTNTFTVTDNSTGSDPAINSKFILMYKVDNSLFQQIAWPVAVGGSISPQVLDKDYAFSITVNWVDNGGNTLYSLSQIFVFTGYLEWFDYGLGQAIAANPQLLQDENYKANKEWLRNLIDSANQAIQIGSSLANAQNMISMAQTLVSNQALNF